MALRSRWTLLALSLTVSAAVLALAVPRTGVDRWLMASALYFQDSHPEMYRPSADPFLRYEPRPGSYRSLGTTFTINRHGVRGPERRVARTPGVARVLVGGGSTTFGFDVDDAQTWPAALEGHLARAGRPTEAWNFGVEAYVLSQVSERLRAQLDPLRPDAIVVQLYNMGVRPFLPSRDPVALGGAVLRDDDAVRENFTAWRPGPEALSPAALRASFWHRVRLARERRRSRPHDSTYGETLSFARAAQLRREALARGIDVLFVSIPATRAGSYYRDALGVPARNLLDLSPAGLPASWVDCHPPPEGLSWIAARVSEALLARGFLARTGSTPPTP